MSTLSTFVRRTKKEIVKDGRSIGRRIVGERNLNVLGFKRTPRSPHTPNDMPAPHPGDMPILTRNGTAVCGKLDAWGGGQPFALVGFKALAAGAQTQGTDLVDFHASASNPTVIASDDLIPGNVEIYEASLYIAARAVTTLGFEGVGFLNSLWLVEYVNGIEKARWSIKKLSAMLGFTGALGAAFGQSHTVALDLPAIPWRRSYDPNVKSKTTLQCSVTTTTVSILDCAFVEDGVRP
jgi:hypothetical protein